MQNEIDITDALLALCPVVLSDGSDGSFPPTRVRRENLLGDENENVGLGNNRLLPVRTVRRPRPLESDDDFWAAIADWPAAAEHPRWRNRPELQRARAERGDRHRLWLPPGRARR